MVQTVEAFGQVHIDHPFPVILTDEHCRFRNGHLTRSTRTITITRWMKVRIKDRLQDVQQRLLDNSVTNCRYTKMPLSAAGLRYRYPSDWLWLVSLAPQFAYQAI